MNDSKLPWVYMVGDKILIRPKKESQVTTSGLYLPPTVTEKAQVLSGYVIKVGPGIPVAAPDDDDEPWKENSSEARFVPLQAKEGDLAVFLQKHAIEVELDNEKFYIVPQGAILMLIREPGIF